MALTCCCWPAWLVLDHLSRHPPRLLSGNPTHLLSQPTDHPTNQPTASAQAAKDRAAAAAARAADQAKHESLLQIIAVLEAEREALKKGALQTKLVQTANAATAAANAALAQVGAMAMGRG